MLAENEAEEWAIDCVDPLTDDCNLTELQRLITIDRLSYFINNNQLVAFHGHPIVILPVMEFGAMVPSLMVLWGPDEVMPTTKIGQELLAALEECGANRVLVRLTARQYAAQPDAGFAVGDEGHLGIYLQRMLDPAGISQPDLPSHLVIRSPQTDLERGFVGDQLRRALTRSNTDGTSELLSNAAGAIYDVISNSELTMGGTQLKSVIALENGIPIGQSSWRIHQEDDLTGQQFVELIDTSVLPHNHNRGLAHVLCGPAEADAIALNQPLIGNLARQTNGGHLRILDNLLRDNAWRITYAIAASGNLHFAEVNGFRC